MRSLAEKGSRLPAVQPRIKATMMDRGSAGADELPPDRLSVSAPSTPPFGQLAAPQDYSAQLSRAQSMVNEDPKLAANLVKEWLTE
jgi:flagellar biosynthesis/type III secretory pathway M-ring protein FliF/YscJ